MITHLLAGAFVSMPCHLHPRSLNCAESLAFLCDEALLETLGHPRQTFVHRGRRIDLLAESRGKSLDDATMPTERQPQACRVYGDYRCHTLWYVVFMHGDEPTRCETRLRAIVYSVRIGPLQPETILPQ
jgi:hypothetical protein